MGCFFVFVACSLLGLRALRREDWLMLLIYMVVGIVAAYFAAAALPMAVGA